MSDQTETFALTDTPFPQVEDVVGRSAPFSALAQQLLQEADQPTPLLLVGEPGTGKRLLGHAVHYSAPSTGPFVVLHCGELPEAVLARELLGSPGGNGILECTQGGTLLLKHVDGMGPRLARRLLRRLDASEGRRPRILGTLNRPTLGTGGGPPLGGPLHALFGERIFEVPPLRHRDEDLELLTDHFLRLFAPGDAAPPVTTSARFALQSHRWPGNIRELRAVLRQAAELGDEIRPEALAIKTRAPAVRPAATSRETSSLKGRALSDIEAEAVRATLSLTRGNRSAAAKLLGISRPTLLRKIRVYSIEL